MQQIVPVSAVIATSNRAGSLSRTFESLLTQSALPLELVVVGILPDEEMETLLADFERRFPPACALRWVVADRGGAGTQRNQGFSLSTQPFVWFFDDDILFEPEAVSTLYGAMETDKQLGGVNAMIVNQSYHAPRFVSRIVFTLMNSRREKSFAGRVIGPAINLLPADRNDLPEIVPVEWLNTTCTMYRREALPNPPFDPFFTGYSLMEDVALSLNVAKRGWKLANVRTARIFHDSQPGEHKSNAKDLARMELVNRHYIMTKVLGRDTLVDYAKLAAFETFNLVGGLRDLKNWPRLMAGKLTGLVEILRRVRSSKKSVH